ncbi:uncharacterized protein K452DRAFT_322038 [Aplosporella prunicola CBS 121167]|uniref:Alcohol dehydrogenase-like N-terminal domain-containing protein n=1 Tax=Aplosporella prunicola CBS 121167 TaxID=1176127 RepID=A0A6A6AYX7_9PEZI|nr:uncharacterized protein K452DRAFT_322038 [Aplosporella prunicola CBS 121167]KAF2137132.1 hypothetical protein K452DRAFT_322038 [Aplosporella prunicola CBS 121167]
MLRNSTIFIRDSQASPELRNEPIPQAGPYDVVVQVHAAALNFRDQAMLSGAYGATGSNNVPLSDGAGEVIAVGGQVTRVQVGDRVVAHCFEHWIGGPFMPEF